MEHKFIQSIKLRFIEVLVKIHWVLELIDYNWDEVLKQK